MVHAKLGRPPVAGATLPLPPRCRDRCRGERSLCPKGPAISYENYLFCTLLNAPPLLGALFLSPRLHLHLRPSSRLPLPSRHGGYSKSLRAGHLLPEAVWIRRQPPSSSTSARSPFAPVRLQQFPGHLVASLSLATIRELLLREFRVIYLPAVLKSNLVSFSQKLLESPVYAMYCILNAEVRFVFAILFI